MILMVNHKQQGLSRANQNTASNTRKVAHDFKKRKAKKELLTKTGNK